MAGARNSLAEPGRVVCSLRVRAALTVRVCPHSLCTPLRRAFEPWSDSLCCSLFVGRARKDAEGRWNAGAIAAAVDNMSAAVVFTVEGRKGKLTFAAVEVRKKDSDELVAIGRQWMAPAWPILSNKSSKL
ncbi:acyl-coenzyme A thioesterase 13-like [Panicum miliaceum]|uniref:Acyl-coenzyme A thioesterase 13-like n=1 Tax=Panicum miliaceum TaxID=4540 RepID=A0A3L6T012_PANMI|nr:acyl-coenzyme A thioesterase 13-like [Panicum miliaceum]